MYKGVRRDSGGRGWVRMGAGGCISTQQAQNKANKVTNRSQGTILTRVCGVEIGWQGWWGGTWPPQIMKGNKVCVRAAQVSPIHAHTAHDVYAQGRTRKRARTSKLPSAKKVDKTKKGERKRKITKKIGKRNTKTEREAQQEAKCLKVKRQNKKRSKSTKNRTKRGIMAAEYPAIINNAN